MDTPQEQIKSGLFSQIGNMGAVLVLTMSAAVGGIFIWAAFKDEIVAIVVFNETVGALQSSVDRLEVISADNQASIKENSVLLLSLKKELDFMILQVRHLQKRDVEHDADVIRDLKEKIRVLEAKK